MDGDAEQMPYTGEVYAGSPDEAATPSGGVSCALDVALAHEYACIMLKSYCERQGGLPLTPQSVKAIADSAKNLAVSVMRSNDTD